MHPRIRTSALAATIAVIAMAIGVTRIVSTYDDFYQTWDEPAHLAAGLEWLDRGTYLFEPLHPPLARVAAAVVPYAAGLRLEDEGGAAARISNDSLFVLGNELLHRGGEYEAQLRRSRAGILVFFTLACAVVFLWGLMLFGPAEAASAVVLFSMLPPILAHSGLATTDAALVLTLPAAVLFWVLWLEEPSALRSIGAGVATGLALLSKHTALMYLPVCVAVLLALRLWSGGGSWNLRDDWRRVAHPRLTGWHYVTVGMATGLVLASGIYLSVRLVRTTSGSDDDRLALAVFPFRPTSSTSVDWSEATADLLTVTLDGTAGLRVLDPWALWRGLRPERSARAETPDPVDAARLATDAGANRFLLGSVIESGDRLDLSVRIYDVASPEPLVTLAVGGSADELADLIQQLAVDVLTRIWRGGAVPRVQELDRVATQSPEALKAYLEAKEAMRRGLVDPAEEAIDRALALDSTFALALVEAVNLKSWVQFMRAELFAGLLDLAERALIHGDSLSPRNRLRAEAVLASVRPYGTRAASNAERILALDSTDIGAWQLLSYYHRAYGWQYGATTADAIEAAERVLGLDPTYTPALNVRAWLASGTGDADDMRQRSRD